MFTTNPTLSILGLNQDFCDEKLVTSHGTAHHHISNYVFWWPCIIFNCHNLKVIKVFGTTGPQKYVWKKWCNHEELRCRVGLLHWWLGRRKGMLKQQVELHGSWRNCNQVIRKLMMSRSQLLNTHGGDIQEPFDRRFLRGAMGTMLKATSIL
jgi:hypothetical protein